MRAIPSSNTISDRERDRGHRRCDVSAGENAFDCRLLHRVGLVEGAERPRLQLAAQLLGKRSLETSAWEQEQTVALSDAPVPKVHLDRTLVSADAGDWLALDGDAARRELRQLVRVWFGLAVQEERRLAGSGPFRDEYGEARGLRTGGQDGQAAQSELVSVAIRAKEHALAPALL